MTNRLSIKYGVKNLENRKFRKILMLTYYPITKQTLFYTKFNEMTKVKALYKIPTKFIYTTNVTALLQIYRCTEVKVTELKVKGQFNLKGQTLSHLIVIYIVAFRVHYLHQI